MARKQSVILTPTQKKELAVSAKSTLKDLRQQHAALVLAEKAANKEFNAAVKALEKPFLDGRKAREKAMTALVKQLTAAEANLAALTSVPAETAVASPTT